MNEINTANKKAKIKHFIIGFSVCIAILSAMVGTAILIQYLSGRRFPKDTFLILTNSFFASGLLMILFYILVLLSDGGAYDLLSYSIKLFWYNTFHKEIRKTNLAPTFKDYREEKSKKKREFTVSYMLFSGLIYLLTGLILLIPFYY